MSNRGGRMGVMAGAATWLAGAGVALAGWSCYQPGWTGYTQSQSGGGEPCSLYVNCPTQIDCIPGATNLVAGGYSNQTVSCNGYKDGVWDRGLHKCIGGTPTATTQQVTIPVQTCSLECI